MTRNDPAPGTPGRRPRRERSARRGAWTALLVSAGLVLLGTAGGTAAVAQDGRAAGALTTGVDGGPEAAAVVAGPSADAPSETPAATPAQTPAETPVEKPAETPVEKPADKPAGAPEDVPGEAPAAAPVDDPAEQEAAVTRPPAKAPREESTATDEPAEGSASSSTRAAGSTGGAASVSARAPLAAPGNEGTVKLEAAPGTDGTANNPHLACALVFKFFGFPAGDNTVQVTLAGQDPTPGPVGTLGSRTSFVFTGSGGGGSTLDHSEPFSLDLSGLGAPQANQGFHVSWDASVNGESPKAKTIWVRACSAPEPPAPLSVGVVKTNDADLDGTFSASERATRAQQPVAFRALVTNTGTTPVRVDALTDSFLDVALPSPCTADPVGRTLAPGATLLCTFTLPDYAPNAGGAPVVNTVRVRVSDPADDTRSASATDTSTVTAPAGVALVHDLRLVKDGPTSPVRAGDALGYTLRISNVGTSPESGFVVMDPLAPGLSLSGLPTGSGYACAAAPAAVSCTYPGTLLPGASTTLTVPTRLAAGYLGTQVVNRASVPLDGDAHPQDNTDTHTATVVLDGPLPALTVDKTNDADGDGGYRDVEAARTAGQTVSFRVAITSRDAALRLTTITDRFAATTLEVCPQLRGTVVARGTTVTCTFTVASYGPAAGRPALTDTVQVDSGLEGGGQGPSASDTSTVTPPSASPEDLSLTKSGPDAAVRPGDVVPYTVVVTNRGSVPVSGFTVGDPLAAGLTLATRPAGPGFVCAAGAAVSCTHAAALAAGASVTLTYTALLAADYARSTVDNTATVPLAGDPTPGDNTDTETTDVVRSLGLAVAKTNDANGDGAYTVAEQAPVGGQAVPFRVRFTNTGRSPVRFDGVTDRFLGTTLPVCASLPGTRLDVGAGVECSFVLQGYAPSQGAAAVVNTVEARVSRVGDPADTATGSSTSTVAPPAAVAPRHDLALDKRGPGTAVAPGDAITYTLQVTNRGTVAESGFVVSDPLAPGLSLAGVPSGAGFTCSAGPGVQCTYGPALQTGGSVSLTVPTRLSAGFAADRVVNTATVPLAGDVTPADNTDTETTPVRLRVVEPPSLGLSVVKTNDADGDGVSTDTETARSAGQAVAFRALVTNTGSAAVRLDAVTDRYLATTLPAPCPGLVGTVLAPGATAACVFTVPAYAPAAGGLPVTNTVQVAASRTTSPGDTVGGSDTSTVRPPAAAPRLDLALTKTGPAAAVARGSVVPYTLTVVNNGDVAVSGFTVSDPLAPGLTLAAVPVGAGYVCAAGPTVSCTHPAALAPGQTTTLQLGALLDAGYAGSSVLNRATVPLDGDVTPLDNTDQAITPVLAAGLTPLVTLVKTNDADQDGVHHQVETARAARQPVAFRAVLRNTGAVPVRVDELSDAVTDYVLPSPCQEPVEGLVLQPQQETTCTFTLDAYAPAPADGDVVNTMRLVASQVGVPTVTATAEATSTVRAPDAGPDLAVVKTSSSSVQRGKTLDYTLTVSNHGTVPVAGFTVLDVLPAGLTLVGSPSGPGFTCEPGPSVRCTYAAALAPGAQAVVRLTALLARDYVPESLSNTVTVPLEGDVVPEDNTDTALTPVLQPALTPTDLSLDKIGPVGPVLPGGRLRYRVLVTNTGSAPATGFTVEDRLPAGLALVGTPQGVGFTCAPGPVVSCRYPGTLAPGSTAELEYVADLSPLYTGTVVVNTATVPLVGDPTPEDNTDTVTTPVGRRTPPPQPPRHRPPPPVTPPEDLPRTGSDTGAAVSGALVALLLGLGLQRAGRRRRLLAG